MKKADMLTSALAYSVLLLATGCANVLTEKKAIAVLDKPGLHDKGKPMSVSNLWTHLGRESGVYPCTDLEPSHAPYGVAEDKKYEVAGLLTIKCNADGAWFTTLTADGTKGLEHEPDANGTAFIRLDAFDHFKISKIDQTDKRATVAFLWVFSFTPTMAMLAKKDVFPDLRNDSCSYDLPARAVECIDEAQMAFYDGAWRIDRSNIKKKNRD